MDRKAFDNEIDNLLNRAEALIPEENLPDLPYMDLAPDVHDWYAVLKWDVLPNENPFSIEDGFFVCIIHSSIFIIHYSFFRNGFSNE